MGVRAFSRAGEDAIKLPSAIVWVAVYLALVLAPLAVLFVGGAPGGSGFWWDLSMALGFAAMAMAGVQFLLTARFKRLSAPFGIDIIYYFHRFLAVVGFSVIVLHVVIVLVETPSALTALDPFAEWHMSAGIAAFLLFAALIVTSIWRKQIGWNYDGWRLWHAVFATAAFLLALAHIQGVGNYIGEPATRALWTALTVLWVLLIVYVRLIKPGRLVRLPYRVQEVRKERGRVWTLALKPESHAGMSFRPGQFVWLSLGVSPFRLQEHPFSISSAPAADGGIELTVKELGDFTRTMGFVPQGRIAYVDGPHGVFCTDRFPDAPGFVFIVGGVGIAPVMSMLRMLRGAGDARPLILFDCNRVWDHVVFREELETEMAPLRLKVVHVLSEPPADWSGERGFLSRDILARHLSGDFTRSEYFVCGPNPMIRIAEHALVGLGVPLARIHSEIFDLA